MIGIDHEIFYGELNLGRQSECLGKISNARMSANDWLDRRHHICCHDSFGPHIDMTKNGSGLRISI